MRSRVFFLFRNSLDRFDISFFRVAVKQQPLDTDQDYEDHGEDVGYEISEDETDILSAASGFIFCFFLFKSDFLAQFLCN